MKESMIDYWWGKLLFGICILYILGMAIFGVVMCYRV